MKNLNLLTPLLVLAALAVSCAKEKEYEEVYKESVSAKAAMPCQDPNDPCIYVPSVGETPKDVDASRSFALGEQKLVTFKFEEKKLIVQELPREDRFSGNTSNFSPVMEFAVEHKDYQCKEDQFGDCGNTEEEVDRTWDRKKYAKIDFGSIEVVETNSLPEQLTNLFAGCYGAGKTVVRNVKIEKDAINIHVQKTWKTNGHCAEVRSIGDLRDTAFTVNYYYSFAKLSTIASANYKPVKYPFEDQNTFGFFTTEVMKLTADNRTTVNSKQTYMNRWSPDRKEIIYYLNDAFYEAGMESVLASTEQAIATINNSFESAGVDMRIKLQDGRGKDMGDIRNNFILLVSDPQASGVIGYGPSIANPRTGEIVKAHTVMYYGTIRKFIQDTYDELLEERAREEAAAAAATLAANAEIVPNAPATEESAERLSAHRSVMSRMQTAVSPSVQRPVTPVNRGQFTQVDFKKEIFNSRRKIEKSHWVEQLKNPSELTDSQIAKAKLNVMSHQCFYHTSMVNWSDAVGSNISAQALGIEALKPWNELSEAEKEKVITALMPNVWVPTLVHEFGHNLGLRHNFNGSEDKDNFFTAAERASLGIKRDITYSSVMDYAGTSLNQLSVMGKYDMAALSFAYNREVQLKDGKKLKLSDDLTIEELKKNGQAELLKDFQFCTDEHVEVNPGCNRFDDGSGLKEIAENFVKNYKENYARRNFRNLRADFNSYDGDVSYYFQVEYTFEGLRRFFEIYDRLSTMYPWTVTADWEKMIAEAKDEEERAVHRSNRDFFVGLKDAAQVAADFYVEVLTTPDVHCAIINTTTNRLAGILPLADIGGGEASSCFSDKVRLAPQFASIGETGKFFNSQRFDETLPGELNADPSQISVRGIWADKILAADYLTKRVLGISTFDDQRGNFLDYPAFGDKVRSTVLAFMTNSLEVEAEFKLADGSVAKIPHVFDIAATHKIKRSFHQGLNRYLGMTKIETDFRQIMLPYVKNSASAADDRIANWGFFNALDVLRLETSTVFSPDRIVKTVDFNDANQNLIARFAATKENTVALELAELREIRQALEKFDPKAVQQVYVMRAQNKVPEEIPEALKPLFDMPLENLLAFLQGALPDDASLLDTFLILRRM